MYNPAKSVMDLFSPLYITCSLVHVQGIALGKSSYDQSAYVYTTIAHLGLKLSLTLALVGQ